MIAKRKGAVARRGLKEAWSQDASRWTIHRIRGIRRRTSGQGTVKSISIKGAGCKSGGCALKAVSLITGGLLHVLESELRVKRFTLIVRQESAAGVVAASAAKAQTEGSGK